MDEGRFYPGLERGMFVQIGLPLFVFGPFLVIAFRAYEAAKLTGLFIPYGLFSFLYVIPWIMGLRIKKAIKDAETAKVLSQEAAELSKSWLRSAEWSTYSVMAIIVLFSKLLLIR